MSSCPKPQDTKPRRAEALITGRPYKLSYVAREKSKFPNKTGQNVFKVIAVFYDFGMKFHTYLPYEFDKKTEEDVIDYNKIKAGQTVSVVYYGKISRCHQVEILEDGEGNFPIYSCVILILNTFTILLSINCSSFCFLQKSMLTSCKQ